MARAHLSVHRIHQAKISLHEIHLDEAILRMMALEALDLPKTFDDPARLSHFSTVLPVIHFVTTSMHVHSDLCFNLFSNNLRRVVPRSY